jgi:uncharacterized protein YprB with RNaseH-like and TPR domain
MSDSSELRRRLSRLGRGRAAGRAAVLGVPPQGDLPPGSEVATPAGPAYRIDNRYPLDYLHGPGRLADLLSFEGGLAADVASQPDLADIPIEKLAFLDTETTGLVGGAGTLVFLVGIGTFQAGGFYLRQYFLRTPTEEAGMLQALQDDLETSSGFVTFNGQAFDLPLLETRYLIGLRRHWALTTWPHLDLLHPSRRLWRRVLPDCSLSTLESRMLGVQRTEADVPGALIPAMYLNYLRTGETGGMARVVYHNALDVLSLVGLAAQVLERHRQERLGQLSGQEALAVARWHQTAGRLKPAEEAYHAALAAGDDPALGLEARRRYTRHLKRLGRSEEALEGWIAWHSLEPADPEPCLELAKYYEWRARDLPEARRWAEVALICLTHWDPDWRRDEAWEAVEHRLKRLARKMDPGR